MQFRLFVLATFAALAMASPAAEKRQSNPSCFSSLTNAQLARSAATVQAPSPSAALVAALELLEYEFRAKWCKNVNVNCPYCNEFRCTSTHITPVFVL
ncbi:hypothetical protein WG66_000007 [Moniliophthora roreri]|uniref:Uncharacterized protein n=1 Tax=Moniliophthora roreri TaxID=221103 RepID=A0A0W0G6N1_MONRR|nr:hypothetical protein WG66_000007 [Moniliophthora roreri]